MASPRKLLGCGLALLHAFAARAAAQAAEPIALGSSDDPFSKFAPQSQWSPAVEAKFNALKAKAQNATEAMQAAEQDAANARAAELGWQLAVVALLGVVIGGFAYGQRRGAWSLKPKTLSEPLLPVNGIVVHEKLKEAVQVQAAAPSSEEINKWQSMAKQDMASAKTQEAYTKRALQELQQGQSQLKAEVAQARGGEATAQKALKEMQAWAEASVAQAQAREAAAAKALQELRARSQTELKEAQEREAAARKALQEHPGGAVMAQAQAREAAASRALQELRAGSQAELREAHEREAAARKALQDFQRRAETEVANAKAEERAARKAAQELQEEVQLLRSRLAGFQRAEPPQLPPRKEAGEPTKAQEQRMREAQEQQKALMQQKGHDQQRCEAHAQQNLQGQVQREAHEQQKAQEQQRAHDQRQREALEHQRQREAQDMRPRALSPPPLLQVRSMTPAGTAGRARAPSPAGILPQMVPGTPSTDWPSTSFGLSPSSSLASFGGLLPPQPLMLNLPNRMHLVAEMGGNPHAGKPGTFSVGTPKAA